jgi:hypothetical protein
MDAKPPTIGRRPVDLFDAARKHEPVRPICVGLLTSALQPATQAEEVTLRELLPLGRPRALELLVSPGAVPTFLQVRPDYLAPTFEIVRRDDQWEAHTKTEDEESWTWLIGADRWDYAAKEHFPAEPSRVAQLREIDALRELGADVVIATDPELLSHRLDRWLAPMSLMSVEEAAVVIGIWSRLTHRAFVASPMGVNTGLYYWALTRALTPAAWPGFAAAVRLQRHDDRDREVFDLFGSILTRLTSVSRALDGLVALWQCPRNNDTTAELLDDFDRTILGSWAIYDNLALLVGKSLHISLGTPTQWSLLHPAWRRALEACGDSRARPLLDYIVGQTAHLEVSQEVRHQLIHRARFNPIAVRGRDATMEVDGGTLARIEAALRTIGADPADWGFDGTYGPGTMTVTDVNDPNAEYEFERGRWALIRPVPFAIRTAAHVARFTNEIVEHLDLAADPRLAGQPRFSAPSDPYFSPRGAAMAVLLSPLSGLVDWVPPPGP